MNIKRTKKTKQKTRKMKVTIIPIVVGALGMVNKSLKKKTWGIGKQKKNRDHQPLLKSAGIFGIVLDNCDDLL